MKRTFKARIYKVGVNPCVEVPRRITKSMQPEKGFIPVKGKIGKHLFKQTLVPVKNGPYRLYVNGSMIKGSGHAVGDLVGFVIEQDFQKRTVKMPAALDRVMRKEGLYPVFKSLKASARKDILTYLNNLKTKEAFDRNVQRVVARLKRVTSEDFALRSLLYPGRTLMKRTRR